MLPFVQVAFVLAGVAVYYRTGARASAFATESTEDDSPFNLERLCALRDSGALTSDEYTRLSRMALEMVPALESLTLIRELRDKGVLSVPEYEAFKERVVRRVKEEEDLFADARD